jgi:hypothetical protein
MFRLARCEFGKDVDGGGFLKLLDFNHDILNLYGDGMSRFYYCPYCGNLTKDIRIED